MANTAQMQRTQEKTSSWSAIFPNETITEQQSTLFVKKLVAVAVSNIAYLRAIFPEHSFGDRCLEDLNLKILRDDSSCPGACQVIKWVKGCFDAIEKKYLRMLVIGIYVDPDDPDTVIESYTFKFSYNNAEGGIDIYRNDKKISSAYSAAETKKATIRLLRTIVVLTQTLKSLPDDVMMTMKLLYYDDVTPADYEPPGFKAAETDAFHFEEEPMNIKVGDVNTQFHTIKMRIKTDKSQFEMKEDVEEDKEETTEVTTINIEDNNMEEDSQMQPVNEEEMYSCKDDEINRKNKTKRKKSPEAVVPSESPEVPGSDEMAVDTTGSQSQESVTADLGVRCPCGVNEDDGLMILCAVCKYWQHGICFLIKEETEAPEAHFCDLCSSMDDPEKLPTDPHLIGLSSVAVQATCLWRRTLMAVPELNRILAPSVAKRLGVEVNVAQGLVNRLDKEGFIKSSGKGKKLGKVVDKEKLKIEGYKKYLVRKKVEVPVKETRDHVMNEKGDDAFKKPQQNPSDIDHSIDKLASMTEDIELSRPKKGRKRGKKQKENKEEEETNTQQIVPEKEQKKARKRAISKVDEYEFDIADSQMESQDLVEERSSSKKKKASIVSKAIMV